MLEGGKSLGISVLEKRRLPLKAVNMVNKHANRVFYISVIVVSENISKMIFINFRSDVYR